MKIYVKKYERIAPNKIKIQGDFISLMSRQNVEIPSQYDTKLIPLGVSIKLPPYCYAELITHEDLLSKHNCTLTGEYMIKDNSDINKEWLIPVKSNSITPLVIPEDTNILKFKIHLQKNAPIWEKIKWFFDRKIEIIFIDIL